MNDELGTMFVVLVLFPLGELYSIILTNWEEFINANDGNYVSFAFFQ